jgi:hypothetical protein
MLGKRQPQQASRAREVRRPGEVGVASLQKALNPAAISPVGV